jgi:terminase, large subunit
MSTAPDFSHLSQHRAGDYSHGLANLELVLRKAAADTLYIKERLTGSEWADHKGWLPAGTGAETGRIKLYGYQRGVLDAMCDPTIPIITVPKSTRVGYTRLLLLATGYHLEQDPTSCVIAQPTITDAEDFGRSEVGPMLRETPCLSRLIRPIRKGDSQDTLTDIFLSNGGVLRLRGAASDDAFRRYPARFQAADEVDAEGWFSRGERSQGDKLKLLWDRGGSYWNRKQIRGGTPVIEESSRVWREWLLSDQRKYFVPCPHCGEMQSIEWGGPEVAYGLKWELDDLGGVKAVWYVCRAKGCLIDEGSKIEMDAAGEWRPTARAKTPGHAGFHMWAGMSLMPNAAWPVIVQEWTEAQADPATLVQPFVNLRLGRPYKLTYGQELKSERFSSRREAYPSELPPGVLFITAGADVQSGEGKDPRIEVSVYGWGKGSESWLLGHWIIKGDPSSPQVWQELHALLKRGFVAVDGRRYPISAAAIDSGGHHTAETYEFVSAHSRETSPRIWAIKGSSEQRGRRKPVWPRKPSKGKGGTVYMIGGNAARDFVYRSLAVQTPGPRYVHFPAQEIGGSVEIDDEWFRQLTRERLTVRKGGFTEWVKPKESHEAGVCFVYAYAAVCGLQQADQRFLRAVEAGKVVSTQHEEPEASEEAGETEQKADEPAKKEEPAAPPVVRAVGPVSVVRKRRQVRSSFMNR